MFKEPANEFLSSEHDFLPFSPYPRACERALWNELSAETQSFLINEGEKYLGFDYPYLKATDFMEFSRSGNRSIYEDKLFSKRRALDALVLAECTEHSGRFMDDIINGIYAICDESAWQLPAHNSYIRDTRQHILPDTDRPVIELFSCEVSAVLSTVFYLLKDELDMVSPFICKRIMSEIRKRVITPYLTKHFWWMGKGNEPMCNWTIWCTQNILLTAFFLPLSENMRRKILKKACSGVDFFLKDYGDDGCCDEGAQYYRHAGLCLFQTLDILCSVCGDSFKPLWSDEKVKNIALYIFNVHVDDKYYINFADCSPVAGRAGVREYLFGKTCLLKNLSDFAALDYKLNPNPFQPDENNLYYRLQEVFTRDELLQAAPDAYPSHMSVFYRSAGLWIARNEVYTAAAKCGDNDDSHNHNDTGSITLYKNGMPFLIDIGVESYTAKTFSDRRYEIWTMQSDYHNLPTINGYMQMNGRDYRAVNTEYAFTADGGHISMDIAPAYPKEAGIKSYIRNLSLDGTGLIIKDSCSFTEGCPHQVILNLITYEKPEVNNNIINIGTLGSISLPDGCRITVETLPVTDPRLMVCWKHDIYRLRLYPQGDAFSISVS